MLGGAVISMENYYAPSLTVDDSNDFETIDFLLLIQNLEVYFALIQGHLRYCLFL